MFQIRHLNALAESLKDVQPYCEVGDVEWAMWRDVVIAIARTCQQFNPNFNPARFFSACGTGSTTDEATAKCIRALAGDRLRLKSEEP